MTRHGTAIEWTHLPGFKGETWNPVTGCAVVSPGCTNCYAMRVAGERLKGHDAYKGLTRATKAGPVWTGDVRLLRDRLADPLRWAKPRSVFVNSMGDLFHEAVPDTFIDKVFAVMALCPQHVFMILTKRPERMRRYLYGNPQAADKDLPAARVVRAARRLKADEAGGLVPWERSFDWPLPNVWLGVSAEDQVRADERVPLLLATPAAKRFVSCEPLLGSIDLHAAVGGTLWLGGQRGCSGRHAHQGRSGEVIHGVLHASDPRFPHHHHDERCGPGLDWVIAGGESGPSARPSHPDWFRSLRDQCAAAEVPFFFKQWGEWAPPVPSEYVAQGKSWEDGTESRRVGKRAAGHMLDGREHFEFPEAGHAGR